MINTNLDKIIEEKKNFIEYRSESKIVFKRNNNIKSKALIDFPINSSECIQ